MNQVVEVAELKRHWMASGGGGGGAGGDGIPEGHSTRSDLMHTDGVGNNVGHRDVTHSPHDEVCDRNSQRPQHSEPNPESKNSQR